MMDSALCLHSGALHIPSTTSQAAGLARPYSSFRPSSLSLFSKASTYRTLSRHTFSSPVTCALNKPSPPSPYYDKDNGKKIVIVVGGASVVLACVLGVINYNFNFSPAAIAAPIVVSRPKAALDSLLTVNKHLATSKSTWSVFRSTPQLNIPETPTNEDYYNLKIAVADLIKSGNCDEAETKLRGLYENIQGSEVKYNVEMELVLVLIFQEKYKEALKCKCLSDAKVDSDGRVSLYKAIIYTMLDRDQEPQYRKEAEKYWKHFVKSFQSEPQP
ncbi:uncharacterized protein LOC133732972 [Rosa rugosa]|uniref:uncharacterized protein LOC133732972 n=1 Tax=Rosa rugosa TaxID=74645 RepID=UPI002B411C3C|nr:uncharacterized protein LOC133732972 [Rosa rugosa]